MGQTEYTIRIPCACSENRVLPELSIPAAGQKDRGLWGRDSRMVLSVADDGAGVLALPGFFPSAILVSPQNRWVGAPGPLP